MITNEIKARIAELQKEIDEVHEERRKLIMDFGISLGTTSTGGINLTELDEWAREVITLNAEMAELADERRALRASKRELAPCECNCH
jgi:outer membrane murein-binding lipoprotein Lpp